MTYWTDTTVAGESITWGDAPADGVDEAVQWVRENHPQDLNDPTYKRLYEATEYIAGLFFRRDLGREPTPAEISYGLQFSLAPYLNQTKV